MEQIKPALTLLISILAAGLSFIDTYTAYGRAVAVTISVIAGIYTIYTNYKRNKNGN